MTPRQRRAAAYHEAGHAVVGVVERTGVRHAEIGEVDDRLGSVLHTYIGRRWGGDWPPADRCLREIRSTLAGVEAERVAMGRRNNVGFGVRRITGGMSYSEVGSDRVRAVDFALHLGIEDTTPYEEETSALVAEHWPAIERVAEELLRVGSIDRRAIVAAVRQGPTPPAGRLLVLR